MARTLADMTPEERQASVGMWCEFELGALSILQQVGIDRAYCIIPNGFNVEQSMRLERLAPRFDLPRAWNPDGTPVVTRQEWAARLESGGASITRTRSEAEQAHARHREQYENHGTGPYDMLGPLPPAPVGIQYRFTTEWEAADE